jgi:oligoribonuclease NrnB/cAMP/cGMP phosphodiesterase (DHH superfamily)
MKTVILYHGEGSCPDGFGAAYAAWKKFGEHAEYVPLSRSDAVPVELAQDADVYMLDFTYNDQADVDTLAAAAASLTILDHHEGVRAQTESVPNHVYDENRSGAGIAWDYFHPGTKRPKLIDHLEDDDLFRFTLPDTRPVLAYLGLSPFTFEFFDEVAATLENPEEAEILLAKARVYGECFEKLAALSVRRARTVEFEGYQAGFATAHPYKPIKSLVGNLLAKEKPPIALVVSAHPDGFGVSIRSDGTVDVSVIARKFGGNGHPFSSGFLIPREGPFPWTLIENDETPVD